MTTKRRTTPAPPDVARWDPTVLLCRGLSHSFRWSREYIRATNTAPGTHRYTGACSNGCGVSRTLTTNGAGDLLSSRYTYTENPEYLSRNGRVRKSDVRAALNEVAL